LRSVVLGAGMGEEGRRGGHICLRELSHRKLSGN
jgi:hypothetical protein